MFIYSLNKDKDVDGGVGGASGVFRCGIIFIVVDVDGVAALVVAVKVTVKLVVR